MSGLGVRPAYTDFGRSIETLYRIIWAWSMNHTQEEKHCSISLFLLRSAWRRLFNPVILASHRVLEQNWLFIMSDEESVQRNRRVGNQRPLHLSAQNISFALVHFMNRVNMVRKVHARHLHQMTYPGHRAGVTTDSSTQTRGVSPVAYSQRYSELSWLKEKELASLSHSSALNAEQQPLLRNESQESLATQLQKTEETILKGLNSRNFALNSIRWLFIAK